MQQILSSPRFQRRPPMTNVLDEWSPPLIKFLCSWRNHSDQNRNTGIRSEDTATQNPFWLLKGWNECVTSGLVQNTGPEKNWPKSSFEVFHKILQQTWIKLLAKPLSQSQEPCSGLKNVHASGLFCGSTNPSSTSQMCCGHRTQVLWKHMSQTVIYKVHSPVHRCFLMGTVGDQCPLGKGRWTEGSHSPSRPQYRHLIPTLPWSLETVWYSS